MNYLCLGVLYQGLGQKGALVCHNVTWDCRVLQSHCSAPHSASTAWTPPRCGYKQRGNQLSPSYRDGVKHQFFTFGQGFFHICLLYSWTLKLFWLIPYPTPDMVQIIWAKRWPFQSQKEFDIKHVGLKKKHVTKAEYMHWDYQFKKMTLGLETLRWLVKNNNQPLNKTQKVTKWTCLR